MYVNAFSLRSFVNTHLLQVAHHVVLVASENTAEELNNLLIIQVVDTFNNTRQKQFYCQVKVSMEFICEGRKENIWSEETFVFQAWLWQMLTNTHTSTRAFLQIILNNLRLGVVATDFCHHGAEFPELSEKTVLVLGVTELAGQGAALAGFGRRGGKGCGGGGWGGAAGAASLRS